MKKPTLFAMLLAVATVCGAVEQASAGPIANPQSAGFSLGVSDMAEDLTFDGPPKNGNGAFLDTASVAKMFNLFDGNGGTLMLNSVVITLTTASNSFHAASVSGECDGFTQDIGDPGKNCTASAQNASVIMALFTIDSTSYSLNPLSDTKDKTASADTEPGQLGDIDPAIFDESFDDPFSTGFSRTIDGTDPALLGKFVGLGQFSVSPQVDLSGDYAWYQAGGNGTVSVSAETQWAGNISVQYGYTVIPPTPTPEPATLLLVGLGLAGVGLGTRRSKRA